MKAITVWQPWASLIACGAKPYEFRGWRPPRSIIGQRIAIHAGARAIKASEVRALIMALKGNPNIRPTCLHKDIALPVLERVLAGIGGSPDTLFGTAPTIALSHVLCTAIVGEPKSGDECAKEFGWNAGNDSDRDGTFNWGWPMQDVQVLAPPIPSRGMQGLWEWTP